MRRKKSTAVQTYFLASALLHGGIVVLLFLSRTPPSQAEPENLAVYSVSQADLEAMKPELPDFATTKPAEKNPDLSAEQLEALKQDREQLPDFQPSPEAVTKADGQIVELSDPAHPQRAPENAHYLSRSNHQVDQETASQEYRINPEVVAPTMSNESSLAHPDAGKIKAKLEGTPGAERGDAGKPDGEKVASLPPRTVKQEEAEPPKPEPARSQEPAKPAEPQATRPENPAEHPEKPLDQKEKLADVGDILAKKEPRELFPPSPAMARLNPLLRPPSTATDSVNPLDRKAGKNEPDRRVALFPDRTRFGQGAGGGENGSAQVDLQQGDLKGAPSNDRLRERRSNATMLNAKEFKFYGYMQRVRRQVNFYWTQAVNNIGQPREKLTRNEYTTLLHVVLDRKGALKSISLTRSCGIHNFDEATLQAFKVAAPFPPPPPGMLEGDEADLPSFEFTIELGHEAPLYSAIDPRSNVMFPGIVWPQ